MKFVCLLVVAAVANAAVALEIVISEGWDSPTKIAVVPFDNAPAVVALDDGYVADIVSFDLMRSGQFSALDSDNMLSYPSRPEEVFFRDWRTLGMDYVVVGRTRLDGGRIGVTYHLFDVNNEREIRSSYLTGDQNSLRDLAHQVSDEVFEEVTGVPGVFATKILYVLVQNAGTNDAIYSLQIADVDGERARTVFTSNDPIMSPSWGPRLERVVYVTFETGRSTIVVQDVETGAREIVSAFEGINSAPVFSPDGRTLAMSLSRDGNAEIYTLDLDDPTSLRRITRTLSAIDTEPNWKPDGDGLIFTSDRGGQPQIYEVDLGTLLVDRLTFEGDYNARARLLPDGTHLVYVHRRDGVYHIAWQDLERGDVKVLTSTSLDESPSIAPNGTMLIYATQEDEGRGILAAVSVDGRVKYQLPSALGDVRDPAWSPYVDSFTSR